MNPLGRYGTVVVRRPWIALALILAFTVFMGYNASQTEFSSSEEDFQPDTEVALANQRVQDKFGAPTQSLTVLLISETNILSRDGLLAQLDTQEGALDRQSIAAVVARTTQSPTGVSCPANMIAEARFLAAVFDEIASYQPAGGQPSTDSGEIPGFMGQIASAAQMLSLEDRRAIIEGGVLSFQFEGMPFPVILSFEPYDPARLRSYLSGSFYGEVLPFLLSKDFSLDPGSAKDAILSITVDGETTGGQLLEIEKELVVLGSVVESSYDGLDVRVVGNELISEAITDATAESIPVLMSIAFASVIVILVIIYRSIFETVLNLITLVFAVIWVFGLGVILGYGFNPAITAVPVLIIGLGIDYGIHLTSRYREELRKGRSVKDALANTEASVGFAIFLTTVTTLVGFMSNANTNVDSIRQFGILAASGIVSSFFLMVTFVPAVKAIVDGRKERLGKPLVREAKDKGEGLGFARERIESNRPELKEEYVCSSGLACINRGLGAGALAARKPLIVLMVVGIVTAVGISGALQVRIQFDFRDFLPQGLEVAESLNRLLDDFNFSSETVYVLAEGDVSQAQVFLALESVREAASQSPYAIPTDPVESPLELALDLSDPASLRYDAAFASIWSAQVETDGDRRPDPDLTDEAVSTLYDALYESEPDGAAGVLHRTEGGYEALVLRIPVSGGGGSESQILAEQMQDAAAPLEDLEGDDLDVIVTGGPIISAEVLDSIGRDQVRSVLITFLVSLGILTLLYVFLRRSITLGLVTILPLLFVIVWGAGSMFYAGIPLNVVTVTILAITVGLGIDYGIHVTQRFLEDLDKVGDPSCALCITVDHTGSALFGSFVTTVVGFGILSLSILPPIAQLGLVTALTIGLAFLAAVFVLPTFLRLWFIYGPGRKAGRSV